MFLPSLSRCQTLYILCFIQDLIHNKKEKNQLLMFIRKSNSFLFPLYPDENTNFRKTKRPPPPKKEQLDKYITFLNSWKVCV